MMGDLDTVSLEIYKYFRVLVTGKMNVNKSIKNTIMPPILVELGFITNSTMVLISTLASKH